MTMDFDNGIHW